jgi:hypothetical protein
MLLEWNMEQSRRRIENEIGSATWNNNNNNNKPAG